MKKTYLIISILVFSFVSGFGQIVTLEKAQQVAKNVYFERANIGQKVDYKDISINKTYTVSDNNQPVYYVFNVSGNKGFVIISAEERTMPVLAYTFEGQYSPDTQNANFNYWMNSYKKQIVYAREKNIKKDKEIKTYWDNYSSPSLSLAKDITAVAPLITTNWDQGCYYNALCPSHGIYSCGRCLTGCVATAMAMVMKYHAYPTHGYSSHSYAHTTANGFSNNFGTLSANFGTTTYNWASMPNNVTSANSSVATLMYHCGVSVEMDYDDQGSGAYLSDATYALTHYFTYSVEYGIRSTYSDADWTLLIKGSLDLSRPVLYGGQDASNGGHAWVCDGYQNSGLYSNMYHFNWGWSGSENGYFYMSNLNPSGYSFTSDQEILYNIYPSPATTPVANFTGSPTTLLVNNIVIFTNTSTNNPLDYLWTVAPSAGTTFVAGSTSTSAAARIRFANAGYYTISLKVTNSAGTDTETKTNYIYVYSTAGVDENDLAKNILIYPNPANDFINIETGIIPSSEINFQIFDILGNKVIEDINGSYTSSNSISVNLSSLQKGVYFITINTSGQTTTKKFVLTK